MQGHSSRFGNEISNLFKSAVVALHSLAFIEFKLYEHKRAKRNLAQRDEKRRLQATSEECLRCSKEEIDKLNNMEAQMKEQENRLAQLKREHEALKATLEAKAKEIT